MVILSLLLKALLHLNSFLVRIQLILEIVNRHNFLYQQIVQLFSLLLSIFFLCLNNTQLLLQLIIKNTMFLDFGLEYLILLLKLEEFLVLINFDHSSIFNCFFTFFSIIYEKIEFLCLSLFFPCNSFQVTGY